MLKLPNVTLLCVETRYPQLAHWAIERCLIGAEFARIVFITDLKNLEDKRQNIEYVQAPPIRTTKDYSEFLLTDLDQYVIGTHVLVIQWDSFVTHPELWTDEFLTYDYIGPVWPHHPKTPVGNGGFSLRSKKLLKAISQLGFIKKHPEDYCICAENKDFLEQQFGIKIAPILVAEQFAVERTSWHPAFGFHGFFNFGKILNDAELRAFIKMLPMNYLSGLDVYDLISNLRQENRVTIAREIAAKVCFKWKMRKHFMKLKFWQMYA